MKLIISEGWQYKDVFFRKEESRYGGAIYPIVRVYYHLQRDPSDGYTGFNFVAVSSYDLIDISLFDNYCTEIVLTGEARSHTGLNSIQFGDICKFDGKEVNNSDDQDDDEIIVTLDQCKYPDLKIRQCGYLNNVFVEHLAQIMLCLRELEEKYTDDTIESNTALYPYAMPKFKGFFDI
jgi:hypothetical protein